MRVFHREHAGRPIRAAWVLEELGEPYELVMLTRDQCASEEHLARHPLGRVPVLDDGDGYVFESTAICLYLADLHPEAGLIGALGSRERARVYQWAIFAPVEIEPPLIAAAFRAEPEPARVASARARFDAAANAVSDALDEHEYLVAERFTIADVLVGTALGFTARAGIADELPANLKDYLARLAARPAYQRALERTTG